MSFSLSSTLSDRWRVEPDEDEVEEKVRDKVQDKVEEGAACKRTAKVYVCGVRECL